MSFFGDILGFEKVNLKSMWDKVRKNPERLLLGAADPLGGKIWGGILGKDYEPIINQFGGPAGDGLLGTGNTGGVYAQAQAKGVNTGPSAMSHDVAETIAAMYGGQGAIGGLGKAAGSFGQAAGAGSATGAGAVGYTPAAGDTAALDAASASAAANPATGSWAGGAKAMAPAASRGMSWQQGLQMGQGLLGQSQQPPQQMAPPPQQQSDDSRNRQLEASMRMQALLSKPRKTPEERLELQQLMKNPTGLL